MADTNSDIRSSYQYKMINTMNKKIIKHLVLILLLSELTFLLTAQSADIVIGKIDTINSKILGEKRPIWIYKPEHLEFDVNNQTKYPVIYLLDGDWHFVSVVGIIQQLSYINGNTICPEMIVVGIPVSDRFRDMTPSCDSIFSKKSGGYDNFISFIGNELMPYIESNYPVAPYKIFIGHSLGGLTVINTLINHTTLFNSYIAIDPSMWWNNQLTLKTTQRALSENKFENTSLYLAIANTLDTGMDTTSVRNDKTKNTLPIRSLLEFSENLHSNPNNKLNFLSKYYSQEKHGSIPLIATYDGLRYIFQFYDLGLTKKDYSDTTFSLAHRIDNHYKKISAKMGYKVRPSENLINTLGYNAMYVKSNRLAEYFFKLNIENYPDSPNAYDSMGDYFVAIKDKKQAINMFEKSLKIKENPETREKLERLEIE